MSRNTVPKHREVLKWLGLLHLNNKFHYIALQEHWINKGERRDMEQSIQQYKSILGMYWMLNRATSWPDQQ